jgi:tetraacyldisaccharide 4'-kinase
MKLRWLLFPLALIFGIITSIRRWLYKNGFFLSRKPDIFTICVGNLKMGGTGKTPHIEYLIQLLQDRFQVALLSRGYGRKTKGFLMLDTVPASEMNAKIAGDEPLQIHLKYPEIPIALSENRYDGYLKLRKEKPDMNVLLLDDGFQHLSFSPACKILLTEYKIPFFKDYPFPAGNLREFPSAAATADMVIVTKCPDEISENEKKYYAQKMKIKKEQPLFFTKFRYLPPYPENPPARQQKTANFSRIILLTGIANSKPLNEHLLQNYKEVIHLKYPDHHQFTSRDIARIMQKIDTHFHDKTALFTTEKDYARLRFSAFENKLSSYPLFTVAVEVDFLFNGKKDFDTECITILNDYYSTPETLSLARNDRSNS